MTAPEENETVLRLCDVVVTDGPRYGEMILLRGLDFSVARGRRILIAYEDRAEAEAFRRVATAERAATSGTVWRHPSAAPKVRMDGVTAAAETEICLVARGELQDDGPDFMLSSGRLVPVTNRSSGVNSIRVPVDALRDAITARLAGAGLTVEHAALVARVLTDADCRGHASHGVGLLPVYLERLRLGGIRANATPEWIWQSHSLGCLDAKGAIGQIAAERAAYWVADAAREHGIAGIGIRNNNHIGMLAAYRDAFQSRRVIGFLTNISGVSVVPPGATKVGIGSNAICLVTPTAGSEPFCIDMATGIVAAGKLREAAAFGLPIPAGWLLDASGVSTRDPMLLDQGGMIPVFGGYKGLGIHLMVEVLAGMVAGDTISPRVHKQRKELDTPMDCSQFFLAIDPARFGGEAADVLLRELHDAVRQSYDDAARPEIYFPDQAEKAAAAHTASQGISLSPEVAACLPDLATAGLPA